MGLWLAGHPITSYSLVCLSVATRHQMKNGREEGRREEGRGERKDNGLEIELPLRSRHVEVSKEGEGMPHVCLTHEGGREQGNPSTFANPFIAFSPLHFPSSMEMSLLGRDTRTWGLKDLQEEMSGVFQSQCKLRVFL